MLICHFFPAKMMDERRILLKCLNDAVSGRGHAPPGLAREMVETVASSGSGAAITVMITSLLKKCADPRQDVRRHRADIPGGYSGRDLDAKTVTPFLESNGFFGRLEIRVVGSILQRKASLRLWIYGQHRQ